MEGALLLDLIWDNVDEWLMKKYLNYSRMI